jgi:hypothetical protein
VFNKQSVKMKRAIIDASSAILLFKTGLFDCLLQTYDIRMTESAHKEVSRSGYPGAVSFMKHLHAGRYTVIQPDRQAAKDRLDSVRPLTFGRGETDTIIAYYECQGDFIVIDDGQGSRYCKRHGVPYINALLFPRILYLARLMSESEYREKTIAIIRRGRYSAKIVAYAETALGQDMVQFLP